MSPARAVLAGCSVPCSPSLRDALPSLPALVSRPPPPPRFCRATLTQQVAPRPPGVCLKGLRPTVSSRPLTLHATRPSRLYFLSVPSLRHFGHRPRPGRRPLSLERSSNSSASLPAPPQAPLLSVSCCDQSPPLKPCPTSLLRVKASGAVLRLWQEHGRPSRGPRRSCWLSLRGLIGRLQRGGPCGPHAACSFAPAAPPTGRPLPPERPSLSPGLPRGAFRGAPARTGVWSGGPSSSAGAVTETRT